jgi:hypothetical protein
MKLFQKICAIITATIFIIRLGIPGYNLLAEGTLFGKGLGIVTCLVPIICLCFYIWALVKNNHKVVPKAFWSSVGTTALSFLIWDVMYFHDIYITHRGDDLKEFLISRGVRWLLGGALSFMCLIQGCFSVLEKTESKTPLQNQNSRKPG